MSPARLARAALLVCAASTALGAQQPVTLTGRIDALSVAPPCAPLATHELRDSGVYLLSTTLDLNTLLAFNRTLAGVQLAATCPLVDVASAVSSPLTLSVCQTPALGCTFTLDLCPSPSSGVFALYASTGNGFAPVSLAIGTVLLDPANLFFVSVGAQTATCQSVPISLTGPPSLVGVDFFVQSVDVSPLGAPTLSNTARFTVLPPGAPCSSAPCY